MRETRKLVLIGIAVLLVTLAGVSPAFAGDNCLHSESNVSAEWPSFISREYVYNVLEDLGYSEKAVAYKGYSVLKSPLPASGPYQEYFEFTGTGAGPSSPHFLWIVITMGGSYMTMCLEDCCIPGDTVGVFGVSILTKKYAFDLTTSSGTGYNPTGNPAACAYQTLSVSSRYDCILVVYGYKACPGGYPAGAWFTVSLQP